MPPASTLNRALSRQQESEKRAYELAAAVTPLIALEGLHVRFPVGRMVLRAIDDVSLSVAPGKRWRWWGRAGAERARWATW